MRCIKCGSEINDTEFRCYVNIHDYCSAECCLEDLIYRKYVVAYDDGTYWFDEELYHDDNKLMNDIGEYRKVGDTTKRTTFESEQYAREFAEEVGGTYKESELSDSMCGKTVYVVEW